MSAGGYLEELGPAYRQGQRSPVGPDRAVLPEFLGDLRRQDLSHSARWRLPHALLPDRRAREGRSEAADDMGRISRRRQGAERQGFQRRRHEGLWLLHRQEAQRSELLVRHRHRRLDGSVERDRPGHVLRHQGHEAPDRQRGVPQGARLPQGVGQIRAAGRTQHGRQRHASAVRLGQMRAQPRLGRRRRAGDRPEGLEGDRQDRLGHHARLEGGA